MDAAVDIENLLLGVTNDERRTSKQRAMSDERDMPTNVVMLSGVHSTILANSAMPVSDIIGQYARESYAQQ